MELSKVLAASIIDDVVQLRASITKSLQKNEPPELILAKVLQQLDALRADMEQIRKTSFKN